MKIKICLLLVLSIFIQSCQQNRMESVMKVHDELMPEMSTIGKLITALEAKMDGTENTQPYEVAKDSLVAAFDYMMEWMKGFGEKFDSDEVLNNKALSAEKEALLLIEEEKVYKMKAMMLGSIENAERLLGN